MNHSTLQKPFINLPAQLPVPLEILIAELLTKNDNPNDIIFILDKNPELACEAVDKMTKGFAMPEYSEVTVGPSRFSYYDSDNINYGTAYFDVVLSGPKKAVNRLTSNGGLFVPKNLPLD